MINNAGRCFAPQSELSWTACFGQERPRGAMAKGAYFIRCGFGDTMTQDDIDRDRVVVEVGFALLKPAEFVIIRILQKAGSD
ncbi:MAG: hypothetical protein ABW127_19425 [Candidatus Thiodiazotropha endolucinida]